MINRKDKMEHFDPPSSTRMALGRTLPSTTDHSRQMKTKPKAVRFSEIDNVYVAVPRVPDEVAEDLYIQRSEIAQSNKRILAEVRKLQHQKCYVHLNRIHCCSVSERIDRLVQLHRDAAPSRGLERLISSEHGRWRMNTRRKLIQDVLSEQQSLASLGVVTPDDKESTLASVAEENSHSARVMARVLALADQRVVHVELDKDDVKDNSENINSCIAPDPVNGVDQLPATGSSSYGASFKHVSFCDVHTSQKKIFKLVRQLKGRTFRVKLTRRHSPTSVIEQLSDAIQDLSTSDETSEHIVP